MKAIIRVLMAVFLFVALISLPLTGADVMVQASVNFTTTTDHPYIDICQVSENSCNNQEN